MKNKTILITGGGGYIGSIVTQYLLQKGYKVRVFDLFVYGKKLFDRVENKDYLQLRKGDVRDNNALQKASKNCYAIVHLAGIVGDMACAVDEHLTLSINVDATKNVVEVVKKNKIPRLVFASSCSVYGIAPRVVNEKSKVNPLSLYAQTKIDAEEMILKAADNTLHPTILRFTTVFGHSLRPRFDLVANLFVAQAYKDKVVTVTGGKQWRPFINVQDIASAIQLTLEAPLPLIDKEIFNVGDDRMHYRIEDLAKKVKRISKNKNVRIVISPNPWDKRNYRVSFTKIKNVLGFEAKVTLEKGLKQMYENFAKNTYPKEITNPLYSNVETIKNLKKLQNI